MKNNAHLLAMFYTIFTKKNDL